MGIKGKHIILGVSGSIAAYKAADLASKLVQAGARVSVILTQAATEFITPLTFRSITHQPVITQWWDPDSELAIQHVHLAESADAVLIAPATADVMAKIAFGLADDPLTGTVLATQAPLLVAPAMDAHMYENPATQHNVALLRDRGATIIGPERGRLASGLVGTGRLASSETILGALAQVLGREGDLKGQKIVVTAGPTEEPLDPVRHISNRSSGKMGFAIAEAARDRGAQVVLITGPTALADPPGITTLHIRTALELRDQVQAAVKDAQAIIMAAAPGDFRAASIAPQKIKKGSEDSMVVELIKNPDIIAETRGDFLKIGFAAESEDLLKNAQTKLREKGLDMIVANDITAENSGFGVDTNKVFLLEPKGEVKELPLLMKSEVADRILDRVGELLAHRGVRPVKT